jgi:Domain of unknown function (DUF929)
MSPTSGTPSPIASSPSVFVYALADPTLFDHVTSVPLAVFNKVGVSSSDAVSPPSILRNQRPFVTTVHGVTVPRSFYWGTEWCPFCAAASWGIIVALARFGHFSHLYEMWSSAQDYAPSSPGFTFHLSSYASPFLAFTGYEQEGPTMGQTLDPPARGIRVLIRKYDSLGAWPFMDLGNFAFVEQSPFDPYILIDQTQDQIGAQLRVASNPETRAIVAWANYLSASICASDHERPASVCRSAGVLRADVRLKLPRP